MVPSVLKHIEGSSSHGKIRLQLKAAEYKHDLKHVEPLRKSYRNQSGANSAVGGNFIFDQLR